MASTPTYTVDLPGAFCSFFEGTGVAQQGSAGYDDPTAVAAADEVHHAWRTARKIVRGRGYSYRLTLHSLDAVRIVDGYVDTCIEVNLYGDCEPSELDAARRLHTRLAALLAVTQEA